MNKQDAINLFGGVSRLARALGIRPQSVSGWRDGPLPERRVNEIIGAAIREGKQNQVANFIRFSKQPSLTRRATDHPAPEQVA